CRRTSLRTTAPGCRPLSLYPALLSRRGSMDDVLTLKRHVRQQDNLTPRPPQFGVQELEKTGLTEQRPAQRRRGKTNDGGPFQRLTTIRQVQSYRGILDRIGRFAGRSNLSLRSRREIDAQAVCQSLRE